jgi:acyl carrier protein
MNEHGEIIDRITAICREAMGVPDLAFDDDLIARGADSIVAVEVVSQIELDYHVNVADLFFSTPTIKALASSVQSQLAQQGLERVP